MIEVAGRPILEHNVRLLVRHGITEIALNTHHLPETIATHFGDGAAFGARIRYSHEDQLLGTAGALRPLRSFFDRTFVVLFGDNLTTCDLGRLIETHRAAGAVATVALYERPDPTSSGIADLTADGRIVRFVEKPKPDEIFSHWVNAGIVVAEPELLDYAGDDGPSDLGRDVLPALIAAGKRVAGYPMTEGLWWIDTPEDYARTRSEFSNRDASGVTSPER